MRLTTISFIILAICTSCGQTDDIDYGPCKFAPAESKFPVVPTAFCEECYFELQVFGKQYSFTGNQFLESPPWEINTISNAFLQFSIVVPVSMDSLNLGLGNTTPLLNWDSLPYSRTSSPPVSASFGIFNYCKDYFEPISNINQSYHRLTHIDMIESYFVERVEANGDDYQFNRFYAYGELKATFNINGEIQVATGTYKIQIIVFEKI